MKSVSDPVSTFSAKTALEKATLCVGFNSPTRLQTELTLAMLDGQESTVRDLSVDEYARLSLLQLAYDKCADAERLIITLVQNRPEKTDQLVSLAHSHGIEIADKVPGQSSNHNIYLHQTPVLPPVDPSTRDKIQEQLQALIALSDGNAPLVMARADALVKTLEKRIEEIQTSYFRQLADNTGPRLDPEFQTVAQSAWLSLEPHTLTAPKDDDARLVRKLAVYFAHRAFVRGCVKISSDENRRIRVLVTSELGALRLLCKNNEARKFASEQIHFTWCLELLSTIAGLGAGLKQGVLMLRQLKVPALKDDLSYWGALDPNTTPWAPIPSALINSIHHYGSLELPSDPQLKSARLALAEFCLDRLGHEKRPNAGETGKFTEESPYWRYCYVRAVEALRANPGGRGQHILKWTRDHDPEEQIKVAAEEAYKVIRHNAGLGPDVSPKRALVTAISWLFQAHLYALGRELDESAIQANLTTLLRRTTEPKSPNP